jgi:hypothetical protein
MSGADSGMVYGAISGEGWALASDLRQSDLESLPSLQTQAAFLVSAGRAAAPLVIEYAN